MSACTLSGCDCPEYQLNLAFRNRCGHCFHTRDKHSGFAAATERATSPAAQATSAIPTPPPPPQPHKQAPPPRPVRSEGPHALSASTPAARQAPPRRPLTSSSTLRVGSSHTHTPSMPASPVARTEAHQAHQLSAPSLPSAPPLPPPLPTSPAPAIPAAAAFLSDPNASGQQWRPSSVGRRKDMPSKPLPDLPVSMMAKSPPAGRSPPPTSFSSPMLVSRKPSVSCGGSPERSPDSRASPGSDWVPNVSGPVPIAAAGASRESDAELQKRIKTKRDQIAREILTSERTYVEMIQILIDQFLMPLKAATNAEAIISMDRINNIFANIPDVLKINTVLLEGLEKRMLNWGPAQLIGDLFLQLTPYLKLYSLYVANFDNSQLALEQAEKLPVFEAFLRDCFANPVCRGQTLRSYLILPVQRIPRYRLLLQELIQSTDQGHPDYQNLVDALEQIKTVAVQINEAIKIQENHQKMLEIQQRFNTPLLAGLTLVEPHRLFIREGVLWKVCRKTSKKRNVFLFNDWIVYASALPTGFIKLHRVIPLDVLSLSDLPDTEKQQNAFQINSDKKSFVVFAENVEDKVNWMLDITKAVTEVRQKHMSFAQAGPAPTAAMREPGYAAPVWQSDNDVTKCMICTTQFTLINRRHHCRMCGHVICGACSGHKMKLPSDLTTKQRVCNTCYNDAKEKGVAVSDDEGETGAGAGAATITATVAASGGGSGTNAK